MATLEEILKKINKTETCHLWQGSLTKRGYGSVYYNYKTYRVHRLIYELEFKIKISRDRELDHLCRVRHCCNPEHLEIVTRAVNARRGIQTKLTEESVIAIRKSSENRNELAFRYDVTPETISDIKLRKSWKGL